MSALAATATEHLARMGEIVASATPGDVLTCVGLGSCIGLALVDRRARVAGLAHVMLPAATPSATQPGKFADLAVPAVLADVEALGGMRRNCSAVLVGGAAMFTFGNGPGQEIGRRNEEAVRAGLDRLRIPVVATMTGGDRGRTLRLEVGSGRIGVREAAGEEIELVAGDDLPTMRRAA